MTERQLVGRSVEEAVAGGIEADQAEEHQLEMPRTRDRGGQRWGCASGSLEKESVAS